MADKIINPPITSMKDAFSVKGYNVVITGGNRGIGRGITQAFAECGANVAIMCRNVESAQAVCEELAPLGGTYLAIKCDMSNYDEVVAAKEEIAKTFDHVGSRTACAKPNGHAGFNHVCSANACSLFQFV